MRVLRIQVRVIVGVSLLSLGCSSPPPATPKSAPTSQQVAERTPVVVEEDLGPLEPVPAPTDLFVVGRLQNPQQALDQIGEWIHFPIPWREGMQREVPEFAGTFAADAPIDVAVTLDPDAFGTPEPMFGVSFGLTDVKATVDALRASGRQVERVSSGVHFVALNSDVRCIVARANGRAPGRLVCGDHRRALDVLGPYMTRTLPTEQLAESDVHLNLRAEPLRRRFGKKAHMLKVGVPIVLREIALGNPRFDTAAADTAHAVADELLLLIDEFDQLSIDVDLLPESGELHADLRFQLNGPRSWTATTLKESAQVAGPAPPLFWNLPKDVSQANYALGRPNKESYRPIMETLHELLLGAAEHFQVSVPSVRAAAQSYRALYENPGTYVYGAGTVPLPQGKEGEPEAIFTSTIGYHLVGIEEDRGLYVRFVDDLIKALNDPKLRKVAEKELDEKLRHLPKIRKVPGTGYPKGSTLYEVKLTPPVMKQLMDTEETELKAPITFQLVVVPDGTRTWLGFATDPGTLKEKVKQTMSPTPENSLATRSGLETFRTQRAISAGFVTLRSYTDNLAALAGIEENMPFTVQSVSLAMPNRGETPILFYSTASSEGPTATISATLPKAALEDMAAAIVAVAAQSGAF